MTESRINMLKAPYGRIRFRVVDVTCIAYFSLIGLLLIFFHKSIPNWPLYVIFHAVVVLCILEIVRWGESNRHKKILWFLRLFYPIVILLIAWFELDRIIPMFFGNYWATDVVIRVEKSLFGVFPNVWLQQFYKPWLDELMNIFYSGYYFFIPVVSLTLYIRKRYEAALAAFSISMFTYLTNFIFFFFLPALAPFMAETLSNQYTQSWTGYAVAELTRFIQSDGTCRGGTLPSSHIAGVFVWSFIALRYQRPLGYVLLPLAFGAALGIVYLGYHYALDAIFGLLWALICFPIALKILKSRNEDPLTSR